MRKLLATLPFLFILLGCNHQDIESDYEAFGTASGNFGFRAILGETDSGDFGEVFSVSGFTVVYDEYSHRVDTFEVQINSVDPFENSDTHELKYIPGKTYQISVNSELGEAFGEVTAPNIERIIFVNLPEIHNPEKDLTVFWRFDGPASNDGAILVEAGNHHSEFLPPNTTSYTIPKKYYENFHGTDIQISVTSIRYVKFPQLVSPDDDFFQFIPGFDDEVGSFFVVYNSVNKYVQIGEDGNASPRTKTKNKNTFPSSISFHGSAAEPEVIPIRATSPTINPDSLC